MKTTGKHGSEVGTFLVFFFFAFVKKNKIVFCLTENRPTPPRPTRPCEGSRGGPVGAQSQGGAVFGDGIWLCYTESKIKKLTHTATIQGAQETPSLSWNHLWPWDLAGDSSSQDRSGGKRREGEVRATSFPTR